MLQGDCLPEPKTNENICLCNCFNIHSLLYKKKTETYEIVFKYNETFMSCSVC